MPTTSGWLFLAAGTFLFFFWAYGFVRFLMDIKGVYIPKGRQFLRGRRRLKEKKREEEEREERERQLY
jgi:hypothetical protein